MGFGLPECENKMDHLACISHQLKRLNGVGGLNRLAFNHLPNGQVLTKFQHSVLQWARGGPGTGPLYLGMDGQSLVAAFFGHDNEEVYPRG